LEAQGFASYRKRKKLTERIFQNFQNIKLRPDKFSDHLLHVVGFGTGRAIDIAYDDPKFPQGFRRPLQVL
jgi:7SK snRNA methylphosphate capping enzyme